MFDLVTLDLKANWSIVLAPDVYRAHVCPFVFDIRKKGIRLLSTESLKRNRISV